MKFRLGIFSLLWKIIVGIIFCVTAILFYPVLAILSSKEKWHKAAFKGFVVWSWTFRIICFYHIKKIEPSKLPAGPVIFAPNHASYLDIFIMHSLFASHPLVFLGKSEILSYPIIKSYFKSFNVPVFRDNKLKAAKSFVQSKRKIQNGWSLVIFPEGGIPDWERPKMMEFKDGAFHLAKQMNVPIVPITFTNNYRLFSDPENVFGPARPGLCNVYIHPAIMPSEIESLTVEELKVKCFEVVNAPIIASHPHLAKNV